jgi:hypothetical protein
VTVKPQHLHGAPYKNWGVWIDNAPIDWTGSVDPYITDHLGGKSPPFYFTAMHAWTEPSWGGLSAQLDAAKARGGLLQVSVFPQDPSPGGYSAGSPPSHTNAEWAAGDFDAWIDGFFGDAITDGRFWVMIWGEECNLDIYTWQDQQDWNTVGSFRAMYEHVYHRVRYVLGCTNVFFLWNANGNSQFLGAVQDLADSIPRPGYFDALSLDFFDWNGDPSATTLRMLYHDGIVGSNLNNYALIQTLRPGEPLTAWSFGYLTADASATLVNSAYRTGRGPSSSGVDNWQQDMPLMTAVFIWDTNHDDIDAAGHAALAIAVQDPMWVTADMHLLRDGMTKKLWRNPPRSIADYNSRNRRSAAC